MFNVQDFVFRSPDGGGGNGDDTPEPKPEPKANGNGAGGDSGFKPITSQEELENTLSDRLARKERKAQEELLSALGVGSLDDAKDALSEYKKLRDAQLSEAEKMQEELDKARQEAEQARAEADKAIAESNERLMHAAVIAEASKSEYSIREDARSDVWLFIDRDEIKVNDDGEYEGIGEAIKTVLESKPYLKGEAQISNNNGIPRTPQPKGKGELSEKEKRRRAARTF